MCITPITLKKSKLKHTFDDELTYLKVPCGKCIECRKARVNQWFVRLSQELKRSTSAYFVTLTYVAVVIYVRLETNMCRRNQE